MSDYYRRIKKPRLLTPEQETELAASIAAVRMEAWNTLFGYARVLPHVAKVALETLPDQTPQNVLEAFTICASDDRRRSNAKTNPRQGVLIKDHDPVDIAIGFGIRYDPGLAHVRKIHERVVSGDTGFRRRYFGPEIAWDQGVAAAARTYQRLKDRFVAANLRLVIPMARTYASFGLLGFEDLVQEGSFGLMKAVDRFDHERGHKFSTYATWWIRHALNRAMADHGRTVRLPAHLVGAMSKLRKAEKQMLIDGEKWGDAELARRCGMSVAKLIQVRRFKEAAPISLDVPVTDDDRVPVRDVLPDESAPDLDDMLDQERQHVHLEDAIDLLPGIEGPVVRARYGLGGEEPCTLGELAERHNLSRERIRQLQNAGVARLQDELSYFQDDEPDL